jgi:murein DD-endopeptidase MepM/ murein hydrolase activator NlpD
MQRAILATAIAITPTTLARCGSTGGGSTGPACTEVDSTEQESAPIQTAASGAPSGASGLTWQAPVAWTSWVAFAGSPGASASHEGIDWIHADPSVAEVDVAVAAPGEVVYVRTGCPESATFSRNTSLRECGSGWGNHVVVDHGGGALSRYAHLADGQVFVEVGDVLGAGDVLAVMGNSGRSETRHLHFELGTLASTVDPCGLAWSFDAVYDPAAVGL